MTIVNKIKKRNTIVFSIFYLLIIFIL